jgi:hypothetical protein
MQFSFGIIVPKVGISYTSITTEKTKGIVALKVVHGGVLFLKLSVMSNPR